MKPINLVIVGCGVIARDYTRDIQKHPNLNLLGYFDVLSERTEKYVAEFGGRAYSSLEEVLADPAVDVVVNLTVQQAHYRVVKKALEAGKHVYTEKPLAMTYAQAKELVDFAKAKNLRLACAPLNFLGEAQQTAMRWVKEGRLGTVRAAYAEVNHGRIEVWHPAPQPFYEVGPLYDVGVYPLTVLTALFGPAQRVTAHGYTLMPDRVTKRGVPFRIEGPDFLVVLIDFPGVVVRLTANFYMSHLTAQGEGIEFFGDVGSLHLVRWFERNARLEYAPHDKKYEPVELLRESPVNFDWGAALSEMAEALEENRPQRVTGAQAAHVVEILESAYTSMREGRTVELTSSFDLPAPMPWAEPTPA